MLLLAILGYFELPETWNGATSRGIYDFWAMVSAYPVITAYLSRSNFNSRQRNVENLLEMADNLRPFLWQDAIAARYREYVNAAIDDLKAMEAALEEVPRDVAPKQLRAVAMNVMNLKNELELHKKQLRPEAMVRPNVMRSLRID